MLHCSPEGQEMHKRHKTCFTKEALERLGATWNEHNPHNQIAPGQMKTKIGIWNALNEKMRIVCGESPSKEACWADNIFGQNPHKSVAKSLRPIKPNDWNNNEYTWLTNFDIESVMNQYDYDTNKTYKYKFIGVFPIDFQAKTMMGQCLFREFCELDIVKMFRRGIRYIGLITNLDKHTEPGSHWTSLFICIDPLLPSFGAYYYDSTASKPPSEIPAFIDSVKAQLATIPRVAHSLPNFQVRYNKVQHQHGNTECGMFSIDYQIRWIKSLNENKHMTFENITQVPNMNDEHIHKYRNVYFRPFQRKAYKAGGGRKRKQ
jgi:hypothetical protein